MAVCGWTSSVEYYRERERERERASVLKQLVSQLCMANGINIYSFFQIS